MNNHYAKFEYKGMKTVGVTDYKKQTPPTHFRCKNIFSSTPVSNKKIFIKCAQMGGAHLQCVTNHYGKLNIKE